MGARLVGAGLVMVLAVLYGCAAPKQSAGYFEIRMAAGDARPGHLQARVPQLSKPIYVSPTIEFTEADVKKAEVLKSESGTKYLRSPSRPDQAIRIRGRGLGPAVGITLTWAASRKLERLTTENKGSRLAILVAGRVISAPLITGVVRKRMLIYGGFTQQDAELLATILNGQYKPHE